MKLPLRFNGPVLIFGGGDADGEAVSEAISLTKFVVAADGGADIALAHGQVPSAVFGDMDSLSSSARHASP